MFKFDMTFDWKKWLKFGWISRDFFFFFLNLLFVWRPLANGELKHICLLSQVSRWMKTDSEFKTEWQTKNEWAHDRVKERWERSREEGGKERHCCQFFFPPSQNQQLLSGSDSAKLISRRECESGEREKRVETLETPAQSCTKPCYVALCEAAHIHSASLWGNRSAHLPDVVMVYQLFRPTNTAVQ